jgi:DNA modification methylase
MKIATSAVIFRDDLYPRIKTSPETVQKYAEDFGVLPPIEVNQHNELIDGWHRWTAHKKNDADEIDVTVTETKNETEFLSLAIARNASHGLQLSQEDKKDMARKIYHVTPAREREEKKKELAALLSVSERTIRNWLSRIDKDEKEAQDKRIFELWLACWTQEEIAEAEDIAQSVVNEKIKDFIGFGKFAKNDKTTAEHLTDFDPPIYNIWKQQSKTTGVNHFGNSEVRWVDNLLYLYTKPFDVVVDPFAGSGSTINICKNRLRRYYVSDRKPIIEREKEIRKHDITDGLPNVPRWQDVKLVYLDPPYWKQAEGQYSEDPSDLGNMCIEDFNNALSGLINTFAKKLKDAYIALIIQPTQWKTENHMGFIDHVGDMLRMVKLPVDMRYSVPYESQQCTAQMVDWAKENRRCLVLTREFVVWRCGG